MKRILFLSVAALVSWTATTNASPILCHSCGCKEAPPPYTPDCGDPCAGRHTCSPEKMARAHQLMEELCNGDCCCVRIQAARRLGCRFHADFCCDCEVAPALVKALLCDPCWEVRRAAAWSLAGQNARTEFVLVALYISSRLDRHYMVRARALEAIDLLTLCRKECYKELFLATDALVKGLAAEKIRPGACKARFILTSLHGPGGAPLTGEAPDGTATARPGQELPRVPEEEVMPRVPSQEPERMRPPLSPEERMKRPAPPPKNP